jgi:hypothetical protein
MKPLSEVATRLLVKQCDAHATVWQILNTAFPQQKFSLLGKKLKFAATTWIFYNFQIQKKIVFLETIRIRGNTVRIARNGRKRKSSESFYSCLEKFVKLQEVNLFLAGF